MNKIEIDKFTFYNADNMDIMKQYPDKYFDLAIVDPPYGIGEDGSKNHTRVRFATSKNYKPFYGNDKNAPNKNYFDELIRVSKNQIIFGANHFISNIPFNSSCWIVWDKDNGDSDFADCELAWTSFNSAVRKFRWKWSGMWQQNMKNKQIRIHPTEKPIELYDWILHKYSNNNQKIIDTHLGSGSIALAIDRANKIDNMNLEFIGIEIDNYYFNESIKRFNESHKQQSLTF